MSQPHSLLVNLAVLMARQPTGISSYIERVVPHLQHLSPTFLCKRPLAGGGHYPIPGNLSPAHGSCGHARRLWWTQFQLPQIYRQLDSRLVFSPVPEAPLYSRCRAVVMVHDLIPLRFPQPRSPLYAYFRHYVPQVVTRVQHIICNSEATARDVVDWYGVPAAKITAIPLAVDGARFRPLPLPEGNYFLYVGRPDLHKNLQRVIQAFARVRQTYEVELWLAGPEDPRFTPGLQKLAAELGVTASLKFLGYVSAGRLVELYSQAIGFMFPSLWEGFGLPVLEAMACGAPVVTSDCSSLPEVTADAAVLVCPQDVDAIAKAMKELIEDDRLRCQLRRAGIERAARFSWRQTGQMTAAVLQKFL